MKYLCDCFDYVGEYVDTVEVDTVASTKAAASIACKPADDDNRPTIRLVRVANENGQLIEVIRL